jgi:hypothetical protein
MLAENDMMEYKIPYSQRVSVCVTSKSYVEIQYTAAVERKDSLQQDCDHHKNLLVAVVVVGPGQALIGGMSARQDMVIIDPEPGICSLPLLITPCLCIVKIILGDEARANNAGG